MQTVENDTAKMSKIKALHTAKTERNFELFSVDGFFVDSVPGGCYDFIQMKTKQ